MTIEIISLGIPPESKQYKATCNVCNTKVKFLANDGIAIDDPRDGLVLKVRCPVCNNSIWVAP